MGEEMKLRFSLLAALAAVTAALAAGTIAPAANAAAPAVSPLSQAVTGTTAAGGTFTGTLNITRFATQNGTLVAVGTLSGTLTDALGTVIGTVTNVPVTVPLAVSGSCQILHLTLGPLDLNLLGLMVHLDRVVLDITAQQGPGNLLGNLLCGIAGLLDSNAGSNAIARLLNQLLGLLG
jgi:hypothetical protein